MGARFLVAARWFGGHPRRSSSAPRLERAFVYVLPIPENISRRYIGAAVEEFRRILVGHDEHGLYFIGETEPRYPEICYHAPGLHTIHVRDWFLKSISSISESDDG